MDSVKLPTLVALLRNRTAIISIVALVAVLVLRITGPSDLYHQTQPKTVSYTTDIVVNGNWILPIEQGHLPATKPPLYNWLAVPFVKLLGFSNELAHKMPSIIALIATWLLVVIAGESLGRKMQRPNVGFTAGLILVASYPMYKLGYLARPDMLLTCFLFGGTYAATVLVIPDRSERSRQHEVLITVWLWICVAGALMTKGPLALAIVCYAILLSLLIHRSLQPLRRAWWWIGLPLSVGCFIVWLLAVCQINPEHVTHQLWHREIIGHLSGQAHDHEDGSVILRWLKGLGDMPAYFMVRFLPWSILACLAMWNIILIERSDGSLNCSNATRMVQGLCLWVIMMIFLGSMIVVKRADYIAAVYPAAAILVAWWWLRVDRGRLQAGIEIVAAGMIAILAVIYSQEWNDVRPGYGQSLRTFIAKAEHELDVNSDIVYTWRTDNSHAPAFLGVSAEPNLSMIREAMRKRDNKFYVLTIYRAEQNDTFAETIARINIKRTVTLHVSSEAADREQGNLGQYQLYRIGSLSNAMD